LLHQKLESINICIETEIRRSRRKNHDDEEEDYYSAEDTEENILTDATPSTPPPMTSDALEEQRRILNFPADSEAVIPHTLCIRENMNRFRCSSKSSKSSLEDFVNWQLKILNLSRKDEIDAFRETMTGDFWRAIWKNSVKTNRHAFDPQREAESALQWIESLSFKEVVNVLAMISVDTAAHVLKHSSTPASELPIVKRSVREIQTRLCKKRTAVSDEFWTFALSHLKTAERHITLGTSLFHRLPQCTYCLRET